MSTSEASAFALSADRDYLVRRGMSKGYQYFSLLTPVLYSIVKVARRRTTSSPWTINRMLRATWLGGALGTVEGGAFEYLRTMQENEERIRERRVYAMYNMSSLRADDHSTIGAVLGALLTPAIFWKRGRSVHLFLGGAGVGAGAGLLAHWGRTIAGDIPRPLLPASKAS